MTNTNSTALPGLKVLFPTFLLEAHYPAFSKERDSLIKRVYQIRDEDQAGRDWSEAHYPNGYTSYHSRDQLYSDPVFKNMVEFIFDCAQQFGSEQAWNLDQFELVMTQLFCNINSRNSYHRDHVHPYSQISGVIYLQCEPGSAMINFNDPRSARWMVPAPLIENRPSNTLVTTVRPEEGKTLMFPSWLEHGVAQNRIDSDRISMSYNFELRMKASS